MSSRFDHAVVRPPAATFAAGLTSSGLGAPDLALARRQHAAYCRALEACGLALVRLEEDAGYPDSTFVEDAAVVHGRLAVLTRPGAPSRAGEVAALEPALRAFFPAPARILAPGTLDGGDVCATDSEVLIGVSGRTNAEGARQLGAHLARSGVPSATIELGATAGLLHLKSGLSWLGAGRLAVVEALAGHPALARYERIALAPEEDYAANCVRVNDRVLVAAGFPRFAAALRRLGLAPVELEMSEFRKMDGGLSCLSLRFSAL